MRKTPWHTPLHAAAPLVIAAILACGAVLVGLGVAGCRAPQPGSAQDTTFALRKEFQGATATVSQRTSRERISMADELTVALEITMPEGCRATVSQDEFAPHSWETGATEQQPPALTATPGRLRQAYLFHLAPFLPGSQTLPAYRITVTGPDGAPPETIRTEAIAITVSSALAATDDAEKLADILPPLPADTFFHRFLLWGLLAAGLGLIAALAWFLYRRKKRAVPPPAPLPPHILAGDALARLLAEYRAGRLDRSLFFLEASAILRRYVEARFQIRAPEQTTEEFLLSLGRGNALLAGHKETLQGFLCLCDLVKFARHQPLPGEIEQAADLCRSFIAQTAPPAPVDPGQTGRPREAGR